MIEELGFNSRQEHETLLHSIQTRSDAHAVSYPVGTRSVLGIKWLECDANHSSSATEVFHGMVLNHGHGQLYLFAFTSHKTELRTCTYFTHVILHLHEKVYKVD
jgi:hypothetical protein